MDEREFQNRAEEALQALDASLGALADVHDLDPEFNAGALSIEFSDPPGRFVLGPNGSVCQIWVSARSKSFKLHWDPERHSFVFPPTGQSLNELISGLISQQLGNTVTL